VVTLKKRKTKKVEKQKGKILEEIKKVEKCKGKKFIITIGKNKRFVL